MKRKGSHELIRNPMTWENNHDGTFLDSSSFVSNSSMKSSQISSSSDSDKGEFVDDEDIDKVLMRNFKFVRRNS